jgi:hypothetical protein
MGYLFRVCALLSRWCFLAAFLQDKKDKHCVFTCGRGKNSEAGFFKVFKKSSNPILKGGFPMTQFLLYRPHPITHYFGD